MVMFFAIYTMLIDLLSKFCFVHFKFHVNILSTLRVMVQRRKGNIQLKKGDNLKTIHNRVIGSA